MQEPPPLSDEASAAATEDLLQSLAVEAGDNGFFERLDDLHSAQFIDAHSAIDGKDTLLVSFELTEDVLHSQSARPISSGVQARTKVAHLTVLASAQTWFRSEAVFALFDDLIDDGFFDDFTRVVFFGAGSAGYAAASFSVAAPSAQVFLIQPQATLTPQVASWDRRFPGTRHMDFTSRYGYAPAMTETASRVTLIYDPSVDEDLVHAQLFAGSRADLLPLPLLGTEGAAALDHAGVLASVLDLYVSGNQAQTSLIKALRARRKTPVYLDTVIEAASARMTPRLADIARAAAYKFTGLAKYKPAEADTAPPNSGAEESQRADFEAAPPLSPAISVASVALMLGGALSRAEEARTAGKASSAHASTSEPSAADTGATDPGTTDEGTVNTPIDGPALQPPEHAAIAEGSVPQMQLQDTDPLQSSSEPEVDVAATPPSAEPHAFTPDAPLFNAAPVTGLTPAPIPDPVPDAIPAAALLPPLEPATQPTATPDTGRTTEVGSPAARAMFPASDALAQDAPEAEGVAEQVRPAQPTSAPPQKNEPKSPPKSPWHIPPRQNGIWAPFAPSSVAPSPAKAAQDTPSGAVAYDPAGTAKSIDQDQTLPETPEFTPFDAPRSAPLAEDVVEEAPNPASDIVSSSQAAWPSLSAPSDAEPETDLSETVAPSPKRATASYGLSETALTKDAVREAAPQSASNAAPLRPAQQKIRPQFDVLKADIARKRSHAPKGLRPGRPGKRRR